MNYFVVWSFGIFVLVLSIMSMLSYIVKEKTLLIPRKYFHLLDNLLSDSLL